MALQFASKSIARLTSVILLAFLSSAIVSRPSAAQTVGVQTFLANPGTVLQQNPAGGAALVSQIRDLVLADHSTLEPIIRLLANATKEQKAAMGAGLAQAAKIIVKTDQPFAAKIQLAVADTKDQDLVLAYGGISGTGDVPTGPTGGGAGAGSAGASGGQTTGLGGAPTGTGGAENIPGSSTNTGQFSYTSSVSGGSSTAGGTTNTTTTTNLVTTVSQ